MQSVFETISEYNKKRQEVTYFKPSLDVQRLLLKLIPVLAVVITKALKSRAKSELTLSDEKEGQVHLKLIKASKSNQTGSDPNLSKTPSSPEKTKDETSSDNSTKEILKVLTKLILDTDGFYKGKVVWPNVKIPMKHTAKGGQLPTNIEVRLDELIENIIESLSKVKHDQSLLTLGFLIPYVFARQLLSTNK